MSLFDRFRSSRDTEQSGYGAIEVDADLAAALTSPGDREGISVRPNKDNGGIEAMADLLESLHSVETESGVLRSDARNISPTHSFEMRYSRASDGGDRVVTLQYLAGDDRTDGTLERQLRTRYPDSQLGRTSSELLPQVAVEGRHVAGATLQLRRYTLYPIKNIDLPGFSTDPTGSILEEMVGTQDESETDADVVVQAQFKPARREWTQGVPNGHGAADDVDENVRGHPSIKTLAKNLRQPTFEKEWRVFTRETVEYPPSKVDKQVAKLLEEQQGEKGWRLVLRVFAISDNPDVAVERASHTAGMFRNFYENNAEQTLVPEPLEGYDLRDVAMHAARREWRDQGIVKAQREVAGLLNVPEAEHVTTNRMRWSMSRPGEGIPPGTPRFEFTEHGVDGSTDEEKQVAMLDESTRDDPYWYGFGSRHGVEAGVEPDVLNVHQFVGGGTGKGKTTFLTNLFSQIVQRGHGGLVFDPKGKDAEEFIREWPEDRDEEDFIFVDLTDEHDHQVRFNFLEVPGDVEPGSRAFGSTVEALADDLTSMISQAGGDDNYWGALMDRVARTLIRGMARSDRTCTLLDLACVCTSPENRDRFAEWMSEERLHFIDEAAQRIREKEDSDLEPLAGRLDQWVQNDAIRDLISARESTVSISEVVRDGKVIVVRNAPSSGETEKRLFATALIRRAWVAVRENPDSPPFYAICDEFDSIVSEQSNIHKILSEARAFEFCLTLACQNPSNQLPERVAKAIENQCETFVSYNPGGRDDARLISAQHSPEVEWEDLTNLSKYKFYMRTHDDNDELTHSYKVNAFPPIGEVREAVTGSPGMTDEELEAFKRRSVERYGEQVKSAEEQKAESHFYPDEGAVAEDDSAGLELTDERRDEILATVFAARVEHGRPEQGVGVPMGDVIEALRRRLDVDGQNVDTLVQRANAEQLVAITNDGARIDLTSDGRTVLFDSGTSGNAGTVAHQAAMEPIAAALAQLGYDIAVPRQTGDEMPDLRASPPLNRGWESVDAAIAARKHVRDEHPEVWNLSGERDVAVEFEKATLTAPAQIGHNLRKGVEAGEHVLFVVSEATGEDTDFAANARKLASTLSEPMLTYRDSRTPNHVDARYYHQDEPCRAVGTEDPDAPRVALPDPDATPRWVADDGALACLRDGDGNEFARFDDLEDWQSRGTADFAVTYRVADDGTVTVLPEDGVGEKYGSMEDFREEYRAVSRPYLPVEEFGGDLPSWGEDFTVVVLPNDDDRALQLYDPDTDACSPVGEGGSQTPKTGFDGAENGGNREDSDDGLFSGPVLDPD